MLPQYSPVTNQLEYLSGSLAGLSTLSFQYPYDYIFTKEFHYLKPGFRACFNGLSDVAPISILYRGLYFGLFDIWKEMRRDHYSLTKKVVVAQGVSIISGVSVRPFRLATDRALGYDRIQKKFYKGTFRELWKIRNEQGVKGLFKGVMSGYHTCLYFDSV
ncbi:predicted protein [Naegleria gruberi]|uniref:ADP/ATP translocase n=1 Tax=Naegleria gruberi TaxID=5762 RepID=D2VZX4_NAEGR|nr:uncharacterized protein NAEGRDRAFT_74651 [Naegleria gruberi]EFC37608.1 predicted protein [Naegleria gruberi]|eukprot:XP_002670352.1 predicted protein [Naegleria gruberi strain NEG-M]